MVVIEEGKLTRPSTPSSSTATEKRSFVSVNFDTIHSFEVELWGSNIGPGFRKLFLISVKEFKCKQT